MAPHMAPHNQQKERLKAGKCGEVIEALRTHLEADEVAEADAAVRSCHRYLSRRKDQLEYPGALANNLPIGSGEIESAHRYIVQKRLKLPGSWWCAANAEYAGLALESGKQTMGQLLESSQKSGLTGHISLNRTRSLM